MGFKFWLNPGIEECYHELLEQGSRLYFMYEILNTDTSNDNIIAYFRNAYNGSIVAITQTSQWENFELTINETSKIRFLILFHK